jgi:hypothetical protein
MNLILIGVDMGSNSDGNVAFKCAWNDAQYKDKCSDCPNTNPSCAQQWIHVTPKECWERHIFEDWEFGVGENRHINQAKKGKVVVFTTKKPFSNHKIVFGVARLKNIEKERHYPAYFPFSESWSDIVLIDPELTVAIPNSIDINFEKYYDKRWSQGLFRYLSDDIVRTILFRIKSEMQAAKCSPQDLHKLEQLISSLSI